MSAQYRRWQALGLAVEAIHYATEDDDQMVTLIGENIDAGLRAAGKAAAPGKQTTKQMDAIHDAMVKAFLRLLADRLKDGINPLGL